MWSFWSHKSNEIYIVYPPTPRRAPVPQGVALVLHYLSSPPPPPSPSLIVFSYFLCIVLLCSLHLALVCFFFIPLFLWVLRCGSECSGVDSDVSDVFPTGYNMLNNPSHEFSPPMIGKLKKENHSDTSFVFIQLIYQSNHLADAPMSSYWFITVYCDCKHPHQAESIKENKSIFHISIYECACVKWTRPEIRSETFIWDTQANVFWSRLP